jgi:hypothetical protein
MRMLPHWTSPQTFGNPQGFFLIVIVVLLSAAAIFGVYTVVREFRAMRTRPRA